MHQLFQIQKYRREIYITIIDDNVIHHTQKGNVLDYEVFHCTTANSRKDSSGQYDTFEFCLIETFLAYTIVTKKEI